MKFSVFRLFRRRRNVLEERVIPTDTGIVDSLLPKKKKHSRRSRFRRRRKPCMRRQNEFNDRDVDDVDDQTEWNSFRNSDGNNNNRRKPNGKKRSVAEIGRPPKRLLRKKERMTFKMHDFAKCAASRGEYRLTPRLKAHGYNWKLQIYPRGDNRSDESTEYVSCFLHYFASKNDRQSPVAKIEYRCGTYKTETQMCTFAIEKGKCSTSWGLENFMRRDRVIENCLDDDGALSIDISIQIAVDPKIVWYPPQLKQEPTLVELYNTVEETGDAAFRLSTTSYRLRPTPSSFCEYKAHKMILALRAKILFELVCEGMTPFEDEPNYCVDVVELPEIDRETFEAMLEHIYTVKQPSIESEEAARKLLVAADRFCLTGLKLYVESVLVDRFATANTAASLLLFADSHSCALLKEATMDIYVSDPDCVIRTPCWSLVEESEIILSELSKHIHTGCRQNFYVDNMHGKQSHNSNRKNASNDSENDLHKIHDNLDQLDIFSIREQLAEHSLDVDGSREALLRRLRSFHEKIECGE